jgi:glycosyltransferase involved in cell wall biosynthesis
MSSSNTFWVVIPAFNEEPVIRGVVASVRKSHPNVVVIDDCSSDATGAEARAGGAIVLRHPINLGQGAALQTGIVFALRMGADRIVTFDADGQHMPEDIEVLVATQMRTGADLVQGSRFQGNAIDLPLLRRAVLKLAVFFMRLTSGAELTDAHNGLRLLTGAAARKLRISHNRMAHASEIIHQAVQLRLKIAEAPVTITYTEYSLRKGQKIGNMFSILSELFVARLNK